MRGRHFRLRIYLLNLQRMGFLLSVNFDLQRRVTDGRVAEDAPIVILIAVAQHRNIGLTVPHTA